MEIRVSFPGGKRVDAECDGFLIETDQPEEAGGDASAPTPFTLFLASLGTCAGIYVLGFCQQREIPTDEIQITQRMRFDSHSHMVTSVELEIEVPASFPERYLPALVNVAKLCAVKKHLETPPEFVVEAHFADG